jgi:mono/diheme cytochrome c family protein
MGIALAAVVLASAVWRRRTARRGSPTHGIPLLSGAVVALVLVVAQGYLGGRMTYDQGVGVFAGGQLAQTAAGAARLGSALADGKSEVAAGRQAFSAQGLGCARCHGDRAQGMRGPRLAGGTDLAHFRRVHAGGLFPARAVSDRDFKAIDAWLHTLGPRG